MKVSGYLTQRIDVTLDNPLEVIEALFKHYFGTERIDCVCIHDGKVCFESDVSIHGSPVYEYYPIADTKEMIELCTALKTCYNLISCKSEKLKEIKK